MVEPYHTRQAPVFKKFAALFRPRAKAQRRKGRKGFGFGFDRIGFLILKTLRLCASHSAVVGSPLMRARGGLDLLLEAGDQFAVGGHQNLKCNV